MNKKRLIITSLISIILVAILMLESTYSLFSFSEDKESLETNVYTTGNLDVTYTVSDETVKLEKSTPITIEQSITIKPYRVTVTNTGTVPYMFDLLLNNTTATDEIDSHYIMTQVGKIEPKTLESCENNIIKEDIIVPAGESVDVDVKVWISDTVQNTEIGKSFFAKLEVDGLAIYNEFEEINNDILIGEYKGEVVITFNPNGGIVNEDKKKVITTLTYGDLPTPTRTDVVTFETNGGSDILFVNNILSSSENLFLNENNFKSTKINFLTDTPNVTTIDYTFEGWYLDREFTNLVTSETTVDLSTNATLYAKWSGDNEITLPNTTRTNYAFEGWYSDNIYQNKIGDPGNTYIVNENITFYGKWTRTHFTLTYNNNGGSGCGTQAISVDNSTYGTLCTPTKPGYTFEGWYTASSGGALVTDTTTIPEKENHTVYAAWAIATYSISYTLNSGTITNEPTSYTVESTSFTLPTPTRTGYTFAGWTGSNGATAQTSVTIPKGTTGDLTYTANWTPTSYSITYNLNSGSITGHRTSYTIETDTFTLVEPTRTGYTFTGWTGSNGTTAQKSVTVSKGTTGNLTYTANWTANTYTITYDNNGGSGCTNKSVTYNSAYGTLCTPSRTGYNFVGWYTTTYKDAPLNYYSDMYADLKNAFGYNASSLYTHWINNGKSEGRRVAEYIETDIVSTASNHTIYAGWIRNFTCAAAGSNTTYAGKTWTTISNSGGVCELALNTVSTTSGSYSNATTNLTTEYFASGTLKTEKDAGLITLIDSASGSGTANKPAGVYWVASGSVYDSTTRYSYTCTNTTTYSGYRPRSGSETEYPSPLTSCTAYSATTLGSNNIHSNAVANSTITYSNSVATASSSRYASTVVTTIKPEANSASVIKLTYTRYNYSSTNPTGAINRSLAEAWQCGESTFGSVTLGHNAHVGSLYPNNSTSYYNYMVHFDGLSNASQYYAYTTIRYYHYAALDTWDGETGGLENMEFGTNSSCKSFTTYTLSSQSPAVYYRLHIKVKI